MSVFLFTGCSIEKDVASSVVQKSDITEIKTSQAFSQEIPEVLQNNEVFQSCMKKNMDMCIEEAKNITDIEISCDQFVLEENQKACEIQNMILKAKDAKNPNLCKDLWTKKEQCMYEVILHTGISQSNVSLCRSLTGATFITCTNQVIGEIAKKEKNEKLCSLVVLADPKNTSEIDMCRKEIQYLNK